MKPPEVPTARNWLRGRPERRGCQGEELHINPRVLPRRFLVAGVASFLLLALLPRNLFPGEPQYPEQVQVAGKTLQLVGHGVREKWFFDVYRMGAYSESGDCSEEVLTSLDEVRSLQIITLRPISSKRMVEALGKALDDNRPPGADLDLDRKIAAFLSFLRRDLPKDGRLELRYVPDVGTMVWMGGQMMGSVIPGKPFADHLWRCYFGPRTCCRGLKKQIRRDCRE